MSGNILKEKYEASDELKNTVKLLKKQVADDLKESKAVRESIEVGLEQALKEQTEAQKELIASKDEMIALLRKQLVEAERVGIKKEQENEKRQQELQEIVNRLEQTSQKEQQEAVRGRDSAEAFPEILFKDCSDIGDEVQIRRYLLIVI